MVPGISDAGNLFSMGMRRVSKLLREKLGSGKVPWMHLENVVLAMEKVGVRG